MKQKILKIKQQIVFWKTHFFNAGYGLNKLLTTKKRINDF